MVWSGAWWDFIEGMFDVRSTDVKVGMKFSARAEQAIKRENQQVNER